MKERFLDIMKWGLILLIAGVIFYVVYPKYYFTGPRGFAWYKCNEITGRVDFWSKEKGWEKMTRDVLKKTEKNKSIISEEDVIWDEDKKRVEGLIHAFLKSYSYKKRKADKFGVKSLPLDYDMKNILYILDFIESDEKAILEDFEKWYREKRLREFAEHKILLKEIKIMKKVDAEIKAKNLP